MPFAWLGADGACVKIAGPEVTLPHATVSEAYVLSLSPERLEEEGFVEVVETPRPDELAFNVGDWDVEDVGGVLTQVWQAEPRSPEAICSLLCAHARQKRWECEQAGLIFDGFALPTNDAGQAYIKGAAQAASLNPALNKNWQVGNDPIAFTTFTNAQLLALGWALDGLVQGAFDVLAQVGTAIADGTITTREQIDAAFAAVNRTFTSEPTE